MSDSAIKFCFRLGHNATETFAKIQQAYGDSVLSRVQVFRWFKAFSNGRESIEDYLAVEGPQLQKSLMSLKSGILCVHRSSLDSQNAWGRVEFESHHRSSDFDQ
ncbi:uncharacterized protein TNCV_2659391 [Trichonephila clavipes]|uniref:Mos1 transposase HTH domain-containing protein n=1 Tax=Trichonephila clavipes TaxID=2585209 RepID=A0A8X6UUT7_TRICX|nr:uncharacterized protein TNCV_2659391 [Trichonephila clavipes]